MNFTLLRYCLLFGTAFAIIGTSIIAWPLAIAYLGILIYQLKTGTL